VPARDWQATNDRTFQCYTRSLIKIMSSPFISWSSFSLVNVLHLAGIFLIALVLNRLLRILTRLLIRPATSQSRVAQSREQQTRTVSGVLYSAGSKIVWAVAILTALSEFGINVTPVAALAGVASVALGFGAQNLIRDIITGFYIVLEDQYVVGDTIQVGETLGRVEHVTLRRTVVRDARGALVTLANGDIRTVANLSRDWSQAFVDIALAPESPVEKTLAALETAATELRGDPSWSQALVDGPRILGVQNIDRNASTVRLQVRTVPTRQDEVARELRRRIQLEFQKQNIPLSSVQRFEFASNSAMLQGVPRTESSVPGTNSALFVSSQSSATGPPETET
jgi:small-conductance mechanosensitive channel